MKAATRILALDLAGATGWALSQRDGSLESGVARLKLRDHEHPGERWRRARQWFREKAAMADVIAWERIVANSGPFASGELFGLQAQLVEVSWELDVQCCMTVAPSTLKKFATGAGRADKAAVMEAAKKKWPSVSLETHDQADALWILEWARAELAERVA